jgi:hypothetical protein
MFANKVLSLAVTLTVVSCASSGCATNMLAAYPSGIWAALRHDASCLELSGSYKAETQEIWPTALSRGNRGNVRISLASLLAEISPSSRPENLSTITRVEINISSKEATLIGAWKDKVSLGAWTCKDGGVLATSISLQDESEGTSNGPIDHHYELRLATDHSLIVRSLEQFTYKIKKDYLRESWFRFPLDPTSVN